jgi:hypothetical protein
MPVTELTIRVMSQEPGNYTSCEPPVLPFKVPYRKADKPYGQESTFYPRNTMEWFKLILISVLAVVGTTGIAETNRRTSKPIEVTLPTSNNPAVLETDSEGKVVSNSAKNFPPTPIPAPKPVPKVAPVANKAKAAAPKVTAASSKPAKPAAAEVENSAPSAQAAPPDLAAVPADTVTQVEEAPSVMEALFRQPASNSESAEAGTEAKPTLPAAAEAAVILSRNQFYPSRINVPQGTRVRIWFTTVEPRPAALVVEGLKMQRWIASENNSVTSGNSPGYFELQREVTRERVTEITLQPSAGTYPFFDALSGARGEIVVE